MRRLLSYAVGLLLLAAVLAPAFRDPHRDSYPLSTFPMFTADRGRVCIDRALGVDAAGRRVSLPPPLLGTGEIVQAQVTLRRAMRGNRAARKGFCRRVAGRVAAQRALDGVLRVEVVSECYDPVAYYVDGPQPQARRKRTGCDVPNG
ncbi:MAG: hypothetical protein ACE5FL_08345 [Myxococcota bacterium]